MLVKFDHTCAVKEKNSIPTIDLEDPYRSTVYRMVEAVGKPRKLELNSLKHADSLDPTTRANGEFFLNCLDESAELSVFGRLIVEGMVKEILRNHHQIAKHFQSGVFPPIKAPIFILGLPRTGSTYLFNLLGSTGRFRTLRHWETHGIARHKPVPIKKLEAAFLLKMRNHVSPGFRTIHEIRLDGPEECTKPTMNCFVSQALPALFHIPRYNQFLETADFLPTYQHYYKRLQILGSLNKRWLLKSPVHLQSIDSLLRVFPDAKFIHLHRDLEDVLGSICSLAASCRCLTSYRLDGKEIGSEVKKFLTRDLAKAKTVLDSNSDRVLNIHYPEIVEQPIRAVENIFDFVGSEFDEGVEQAIQEEMRISIANKHGKHVYRFEDYFSAS